ncbi:DUF4430 domain-containing protein [Bacillus sp. NPDC077411]|uniref:DUF4430 domain-containing protein n=1 Tax=Bacillus sp. NPDC077411 TaxID=3363947 RepID=UPI0037CBDB2F
MKMMKWLVLLVFSFSFIAGCSQNEAKTDTTTKQTEKKDEKKQEGNKQEEHKQEDSKQEQKPAEEQKQEEKRKDEKTAEPKSIEENQSKTKTAEPSQNQKEQSKVVNEPKETPKQENVQQTQVNPVSSPEPKPEPKPEPEKKIVTLSVRDDQGTILGDTEVELQDGDTVFKVLGRTLKKKGIQMEYTGSGSSVYVQGINNLYEKAKGAGSGWKYSVNGIVANMGAGRYKVKQGDKIEWFYTLDYRKEER